MDMESDKLFAPIIDHGTAPGAAADDCSDVQNAHRFWKLAGDEQRHSARHGNSVN